MKMLGVYFSGAGNSKHCVETFVKQYDETCTAISIEAEGVPAAISVADMIVLGYPVYFSNAPKIMQDFILQNKACFAGKKVFVIATMGLCSGDGAGCAARLLKKCGAEIAGGLHLRMPDSIGDEKVLDKTPEEKRTLVRRAEDKIASSAQKLKQGNATKEGLSFLCRMGGLMMQRLWFYTKTASYKSKPDIHKEKCVGCGICEKLCPMKNLMIEDGKAVSRNRCTLCYRCFSHCPAKALTILGRKVYKQHLFENLQ